MRIYLVIFLLIILVAVLGYLFFYPVENKVCFGPNCFSVELAKTDAEREKGLMNRADLAKNAGVLFIFDTEDIYPFWMKNTLIPLDIIWLSKDYKVVFISENAQPCKNLICMPINPSVEAKYVLEINAGIAQKLNIKTGDLVQISPGL